MKNIKSTKLSYLINIPKIGDEGFLCFAESKKHIPFNIKRFYFIYDVEDNSERGHHAHKKCQQVLFCIKGKIKIILDNGFNREELVLKKPNQGIYLGSRIWHEMIGFSKDTILLIVASDFYKEADYIRNYQDFIKLIHQKNKKILKIKGVEKLVQTI